MKYKFLCRQCGICCRHYKIIINLADALKIYHNKKCKFKETFILYTDSDIRFDKDQKEKKWFNIDNKKCLIGIKSNKNGCIYLDNNKCSINDIKPHICYFYPLKYETDNPDFFSVKKYDICSGIFDGDETDWGNIKKKYIEYYINEGWHSDMVEFWNKYYNNKSENEFIIFFYESLYPLFLKKEIESGREI